MINARLICCANSVTDGQRKGAGGQKNKKAYTDCFNVIWFWQQNHAQVKLGLIKVINKTTQDRCHDYTSTHCVDGFEKKLFNTSVILILTTYLMG